MHHVIDADDALLSKDGFFLGGQLQPLVDEIEEANLGRIERQCSVGGRASKTMGSDWPRVPANGDQNTAVTMRAPSARGMG